jgi:hypothetical protein
MAMPWMICRRGCLPLCFVKVLKCGLVLAESTLVPARPALGSVAAQKSALKELKVTAVLLGGLKERPENMLDKRGMRDKGRPKMRALSALCALRVRFRTMGSTPAPVDRTLPCFGWRPGAESGIVRCRNVRSKRTKSRGRLAMPRMIRSRWWRVIGRVLLLDTPYRCKIR